MTPHTSRLWRKPRVVLALLVTLPATFGVAWAAAGSAATTETVTLVVWDGYANSPEVNTVNKLFEKKFPNVEVERVSKGFNDYFTTLKLGISGNNAPDVALGNQGWAADGPLVQAHLIVPLESYAKKYGWLKRGYANLDEFRFSADGRTWGSGRLYGIPHYAAPVGFFYNKQKLRKLGLKVPKTFAQLEHALAAAKEAGEIPIAYANLDKWPGSQEYQMIQNLLVPAKPINEFIYGRGTFVTPQNLRAAAILQEWAKKGYFTPGYNGLSYDQVSGSYPKGQGVFFYTGTWLVSSYNTNRDIGFFILPPLRGGAPVSIGTFGEPWHITAKSKQKDLAAQYLDFLTGPAGQRVFLEAGLIPAMPLGKLPGARAGSPLFRDSVAAWSALAKGGGAVKYLGWATPTITDSSGAFVQELMAERISPKQFLDKVQGDYAKFQKARLKK